MEKKFVANKAMIVNAQGKILLLRDTGKLDHKGHEGKLDFPGGRMDHGEGPIEGLLREIKEELGVESSQVQIDRPFHVGLWGVGGDILNQPIVGIFYVVRPVGEFTITLSEEHSEYVWIDPRQVYTDTITEDVRSIMDVYRGQEGIVVAADDEIKGREGFGLVQVFTGNGKGKTTAALGEVMRAAGAGKRAAVIFFDKGGEHYMERAVLEKLGVPWFAFGRYRIDPVTGRFDFTITDEDRRLGAEGISHAINFVRSDKIDLLVLDEINSSTDLGIIDEQAVLELLDGKSEHTEIVLTGRNAPQSFIDRAHLVTEM